MIKLHNSWAVLTIWGIILARIRVIVAIDIKLGKSRMKQSIVFIELRHGEIDKVRNYNGTSIILWATSVIVASDQQIFNQFEKVLT